jgi:hypothetical protein
MKRRRTTPVPNTLQPGYYIFWQQRTYRVIALDPDNALVLHVEPIPEAPRTTLSLLDLCASPQAGASAPLFAPTLEALHEQIEGLYGITSTIITSDIPDNYVIKARIIVTVVETVRRLVSEETRQAALRGETGLRTQAIGRALETVNKTTIQVQVKETRSARRLQISRAAYYKYVNLYDTYQGNEAAIAASFRRATFRLPQMSKAQFHFIDLCLLLYYGNTRSTKTRVYQLAEDILEKRTQGYWIDPERCGATIPQNLVTELLDLKIPMQARKKACGHRCLGRAHCERCADGWSPGSCSGVTGAGGRHCPHLLPSNSCCVGLSAGMPSLSTVLLDPQSTKYR